MKLITVLLAATLVLAGNVMAAPQVLVQHNEQYHGYMQLPRLAEVVVAANQQPGLYWPAARLYNRSADKLTRLEQQRQQLLQRLMAVTPAQVQSVAQRLFDERQLNVGVLVPEAKP